MLSFGGFQLRTDPVALYRDGQPVKLQGQPLRLLELLAGRRGELITHKEIRQHLWRGHVVNFASGIQVCITQIRKALDDDAAAPKFIETVARHGYRFIAKVDTAQIPDSASLPVAPVIECPPNGVDPATPARTSALHRLTAALLAVAVIGIIGSAAYLAFPKSQSNLRGASAQSLADELSERARHLSSYHQKDRGILAHRLLQRAILLNPRHGPSHALLADLYARYGQAYIGAAEVDDPGAIDRHLQMAERFGAPQSDLFVTRGRIALYKHRQISRAQDFFERAIAADDRNPWAWRLISQSLYLRGNFDDALAASRKAESLSIDPYGVLWDRLLILYFAERYTELLALYDKLQYVQQTGGLTVSLAKYMVGRRQEAFQSIVSALRVRGIAIGDETAAEFLMTAGRENEAYAWLLTEIEKNDEPHVGDRSLAILEILSGDPDRAARRLQSYVQQFRRKEIGTGDDCLCVLTLSIDPFFRRYGTQDVQQALVDTDVVAIETGGTTMAPHHPNT